MISFFPWVEQNRANLSADWLVVGKGPSLDRLESLKQGDYQVVTLNHAIEKTPALIAHMIDIDVFFDCAECIERNARYVLIPWRPHYKNAPSEKTLVDYCRESKALARLCQEGRLLWYNLGTAKRYGHNPESSMIVPVRYFSFEAVFNILALIGAKRVHTVGVDGGRSYAESFTHLIDKTLLANGWQSFDNQFSSITELAFKMRTSHLPVGMELPIRIFVATTEAQMLAVRVLEYSIRKTTALPVEISALHRLNIDIPMPSDAANYPRTPFSFQRFLIPEACGYAGRAIYLDSDMHVFSDIREVWNLPLNGADVLAVGDTSGKGRAPQFSVMLIDCATAQWDIRTIVQSLDNGSLDYRSLMVDMKVARHIEATIPQKWNSLERFEVGKTCLLHYTDMEKQPWVAIHNPLAWLWVRELDNAIRDGHITLEEVKAEISLGHVRPSMLWQLEHGVHDPLQVYFRLKRLDADFAPPYEGLEHVVKKTKVPPLRLLRLLVNAWLRRVLSRKRKEPKSL
tara:strand:- start:2229 stop:3767 length:1539 start_codon:yes stop_codon:yes gene_type:complete